MAVLFLAAVVSAAATFTACVTFRNTGTEPVVVSIRSGDLFEAFDQGTFDQNVQANENRSMTLRPGQTGSMNIEMACIDPDRDPPCPGHQIVPTIFSSGEPDPDRLHARIRDSIRRLRNEY
jgi:hypothetical protein